MNIYRWLAIALLGWCFALSSGAQAIHPIPATQAAQPSQPAAAVSPLSLGFDGQGVALSGRATYWIDPTGNRSIDQVASGGAGLAWLPFDEQRSYRISDQALWLQFDASTARGARWFLVLMHPSVDMAQLYWRGADGRWVMQSAGQQLSVAEWDIPGRLPTFELAPGNGDTVRYWLRLERDRANFTAPLSLHSQSALLEARGREQFVLGGYFGVLLFLAAASLVSALVYRDRNFAAFMAYLGGIGAVQLLYLGVGAQHLWTDWPHWNGMAHLVVPGAATAACLWFVRAITEPARFSRQLDLACWSLIAALLAAVAVNAFVASRASFALVTVLLGASLPIAALLLVLAWRLGRDAYMGVILLGFVPMMLAVLLPLASLLGSITDDDLTRQGLTLATALQLPVIYYALSRRALRRRETGMRAAQLTHADALTGLHDRDSLLRRLDDSLRRALGQRHQCAVLGVRLTNWESLLEEFGRETADRALVVTASILRAAAADIDLAARIGERDFALLLEGPTTGPAALARAQQIVAQGLQHLPALPPATSLKFHVAVTLLPDHELDPARCLQWLHEACNAMRAEPRRAIRSLNF